VQVNASLSWHISCNGNMEKNNIIFTKTNY
jgi:hypothetical protein